MDLGPFRPILAVGPAMVACDLGPMGLGPVELGPMDLGPSELRVLRELGAFGTCGPRGLRPSHVGTV